MAFAPDRSAFLESLPSHPSLEFQQKRAKRLLRDAQARRKIDSLTKPPVEIAADRLALSTSG